MDDSDMCSSMTENEVAELKEALHAQHQLMQKLCVELEEEREASATAVSEALSMILRLQGEKAAEKMEANQYKRMAEERMHHADQSLACFEELMYRKEMEIASLLFQLEAYKHKMLSLGFTDHDIGELELPKNLPFHKGDSLLDDVRVTVTDREGVSLPVMCCKCSSSTAQCVETSLSYSTKRKIRGDTGHDFNTEIGSKNKWNKVIKNEGLSQIHEGMHNIYTESAIEDCSTYWEQIEQMNRRVQELSHCKSVDEGFTSEWVLANKELQETIALYSACLRAGSRTHSSHSAVSGKPLCDSTTGNRAELDAAHSLSCASSEAEDADNLSDFDPCKMPCIETGMNRSTTHCTSVYDIYEVPQNLDSYQLCDPQKQVSHKNILEDENRREKIDLEKEETVKYLHKDDSQWLKKTMLCAHHEEKLSALPSSIKVDSDWFPIDPRYGVVSSQVEVQQLNDRLQLLEDETRIMKQESSERREEEMKLLKTISEQLKMMQSQMRSPKADKRSARDEFLLATAMEAMLSFSI